MNYILEIIWKDSSQKPKFEPYQVEEEAIRIQWVYERYDSVLSARVYKCDPLRSNKIIEDNQMQGEQL